MCVCVCVCVPMRTLRKYIPLNATYARERARSAFANFNQIVYKKKRQIQHTLREKLNFNHNKRKKVLILNAMILK